MTLMSLIDQNVINLVELKNPILIGCLNALIKYLDVRLLKKLILKNNLKIIIV